MIKEKKAGIDSEAILSVFLWIVFICVAVAGVLLLVKRLTGT